MTREEAIKKLKEQQNEFNEHCIDYAGINEAYNMAIKALEQKPCDDCISRQALKRKLQENHDFFVNAYGGFSNMSLNDKARVDEITNCIAMVVNEPSVTPKEKTGKWIDDEFGSKCSCCGIHTHLDKFDRPMKFKHCSMCGAKMIEPQESENK